MTNDHKFTPVAFIGQYSRTLMKICTAVTFSFHYCLGCNHICHLQKVEVFKRAKREMLKKTFLKSIDTSEPRQNTIKMGTKKMSDLAHPALLITLQEI